MVADLRIIDLRWSYPQPATFSLAVPNLTIRNSALTYVTGPSGGGKSTLLGLLAGTLASPIDVDRSLVFPRAAYVMHQSTLAPWLCLDQNVRLEERLRGTPADSQLLIELLARFGLSWSDLRNHFPRQLSLGMRQRFELAKAVSFHPSLLLVDEGFSGIDGPTRDKVIEALGEALTALTCATVFTSHNIIDGLRLADYIVPVREGEVQREQPLLVSRGLRAKLKAEDLLRSQDAWMLL